MHGTKKREKQRPTRSHSFSMGAEQPGRGTSLLAAAQASEFTLQPSGLCSFSTHPRSLAAQPEFCQGEVSFTRPFKRSSPTKKVNNIIAKLCCARWFQLSGPLGSEFEMQSGQAIMNHNVTWSQKRRTLFSECNLMWICSPLQSVCNKTVYFCCFPAHWPKRSQSCMWITLGLLLAWPTPDLLTEVRQWNPECKLCTVKLNLQLCCTRTQQATKGTEVNTKCPHFSIYIKTAAVVELVVCSGVHAVQSLNM